MKRGFIESYETRSVSYQDELTGDLLLNAHYYTSPATG
jgi:hypothetical protein